MAGSREGKLKSPDPVLSARRTSPVASFVTVTFAVGITLFDGSTTVPVIVPVVVCAESGAKTNIASAKTFNVGIKIFDIYRTPFSQSPQQFFSNDNLLQNTK